MSGILSMSQGTGQDFDPGTLVDILRGLAEGRNIDSTPFGMWGVRNMNPVGLATAMDAAQKINEARQAAEMATGAQRYAANAALQGHLGQQDAEYEKSAAGERNALLQYLSHVAQQNNLMDVEKLRSATTLQRGEAKDTAARDVAEIQANPKSMSKLPDNLMLMIGQKLQDTNAKPETLEWIPNMLELAGRADQATAARNMIQGMKKAVAAKPAPGPSLWSRLTNPGGLPTNSTNLSVGTNPDNPLDSDFNPPALDLLRNLYGAYGRGSQTGVGMP